MQVKTKLSKLMLITKHPDIGPKSEYDVYIYQVIFTDKVIYHNLILYCDR